MSVRPVSVSTKPVAVEDCNDREPYHMCVYVDAAAAKWAHCSGPGPPLQHDVVHCRPHDNMFHGMQLSGALIHDFGDVGRLLSVCVLSRLSAIRNLL